MTVKAKIEFTGLDSSRPNNTTAIMFTSWNGRPILQQRQVEAVTRLGGSKLIISNLKKESPQTQVTAILTSNAADVKASIAELETTVQTLGDNKGTRFKYTDENGLVIDNCYIVGDISYNIKACDGPAKAIAYLNFIILTDKGK